MPSPSVRRIITNRRRATFSITNTAFSYDVTSQTTYTFSSLNIGAAHPSRVIVIACASRQAGSVGVASSATINGSSATAVVSGATTGTTNTVNIFQLALAAGTTTNITVTFPSAMLRLGCSVYSILGSNGVAPSGGAIATSLDNGVPSSTPISGTITVPVGGGSIILGCGSVGPPAPTFTPTNYTEDIDQAGGTGLGITSGKDTAGVSGSRAYTITQGIACNNPSGAFAAWSP